MIPGSGSSPGEGIGDPLQYSWASLVAQMVKNPPVMQETWVQSLDREDSPGEGNGNPHFHTLEKEMATHSSVLAGEFRGQRSLVGYSPWGCKESDTNEQLTLNPHAWKHFE